MTKLKRIIVLGTLILVTVFMPFSNTAPHQEHYLAKHSFSLDKRYNNAFVNDVFKYNILLTLSYLKENKSDVKNKFSYEFTLQPGKTFAFHDDVLPEYQNKIDKTTHAHFSSSEGFKSDGWLVGDGVCHLASFIYWVAKDAGLDTKAPTNHDFANIPEVPKKYGVAIYDMPGQTLASAMQNLYVTNNKGKPVVFKFDYDGRNLQISII